MSKVNMWCATFVAYLLLLPCRVEAADRRGGFLSVLHKGDYVSVTDSGGGTIELSVIPGVEQQYKVVEVGQDYIELSSPRDTMRIPVYVIKSIKTRKVGGKN